MLQRDLIDRYYLEHRGKLLDLAAFLDRIDRADSTGDDDFRVAAMRRAMDLLTDGDPDRTRRILELLSDPTQTPIDHATPGPAVGAYRGTVIPTRELYRSAHPHGQPHDG